MNIQTKIALPIIALLVAVLAWVSFSWSPAPDSAKQHTTLKISATPTGGDFTVQMQGKDLSLKELRGKVVVLYFGYSQCPDVCPTSLSLLTQALHQMDDSELAALQSIFVSVDPNRDTTEHLAEYTRYFHNNIIGATSTKENIDIITKMYGASYRIVESDSAMGYIVDHSSYTYIIDKKGKLRHSLQHGTAPDKILQAVRELLAE